MTPTPAVAILEAAKQTRSEIMKSSDMPNSSDLLKGIANSEANVYSALWIAFRLCYRLREKGVLADDDIHAIFDPGSAQQLAPENLREVVLTKLQDMRDQCLSQTKPTSTMDFH